MPAADGSAAGQHADESPLSAADFRAVAFAHEERVQVMESMPVPILPEPIWPLSRTEIARRVEARSEITRREVAGARWREQAAAARAQADALEAHDSDSSRWRPRPPPSTRLGPPPWPPSWSPSEEDAREIPPPPSIGLACLPPRPPGPPPPPHVSVPPLSGDVVEATGEHGTLAAPAFQPSLAPPPSWLPPPGSRGAFFLRAFKACCLRRSTRRAQMNEDCTEPLIRSAHDLGTERALRGRFRIHLPE